MLKVPLVSNDQTLYCDYYIIKNGYYLQQKTDVTKSLWGSFLPRVESERDTLSQPMKANPTARSISKEC